MDLKNKIDRLNRDFAELQTQYILREKHDKKFLKNDIVTFRKSKTSSKNLVKNRNFGQKSKFWSKIGILVKNRNFGQKSKFWSKIEILVKNRNFGQKNSKKYDIFTFVSVLFPMSSFCVTKFTENSRIVSHGAISEN